MSSIRIEVRGLRVGQKSTSQVLLAGPVGVTRSMAEGQEQAKTSSKTGGVGYPRPGPKLSFV